MTYIRPAKKEELAEWIIKQDWYHHDMDAEKIAESLVFTFDVVGPFKRPS